MERLAAISVDLDEIDCYAAIHGLVGERALPQGARRAIYAKALPRLIDLFARLRVPVTFFAIGRDLVHADNCLRLRTAVAQGHEVGNHSLNHLYDLTRRPAAEQIQEVVGGADAIEAATGKRPVGFRSPGYTMTDELLAVLGREGLLYDASVFPCPAYYAAKLLAVGAIALRGRRSHSVIADPRALLAPGHPYRVGTPFYRVGTGMLELPVGVTSAVTGRLPYIGTSLTLAGMLGARALTRIMTGRPFVSLELHGIDLADAEQDGLTELGRYQPDLRRGVAEKERILTTAIETLRAAGYRFVTLVHAAETYGTA